VVEVLDGVVDTVEPSADDVALRPHLNPHDHPILGETHAPSPYEVLVFAITGGK